MFMLVRVKDWNNNIRDIHCFTCTHNTLYVCFRASSPAPSTRLGPVLAGTRGSCGKQREERLSLPDRAPGNVRWRPLSTHCPPVLLAAKREDETRAKQNNPDRPDKTVLQVFWYACPDVFRQHGSGRAAPQSQRKCQAGISNSTQKCKEQFGKVKGTGSIQHGTEEAAAQSDRLWEWAQFVIHSVRCYPKQRNEKSAWRAMFWFRAMQAWGTFPLIFQNS